MSDLVALREPVAVPATAVTITAYLPTWSIRPATISRRLAAVACMHASLGG